LISYNEDIIETHFNNIKHNHNINVEESGGIDGREKGWRSAMAGSIPGLREVKQYLPQVRRAAFHPGIFCFFYHVTALLQFVLIESVVDRAGCFLPGLCNGLVALPVF